MLTFFPPKKIKKRVKPGRVKMKVQKKIVPFFYNFFHLHKPHQKKFGPKARIFFFDDRAGGWLRGRLAEENVSPKAKNVSPKAKNISPKAK